MYLISSRWFFSSKPKKRIIVIIVVAEILTTWFIYLGQTLLCPKELTAFLTDVDPSLFYYACHWEQEQDNILISEETTFSSSCFSMIENIALS